MRHASISTLFPYTTLFRSYDATPFNQILKQNAKREMRLRLGKVTVADVLRSRSEERFSRNAETDLVCRLLHEKKNDQNRHLNLRRATSTRAFACRSHTGRE